MATDTVGTAIPSRNDPIEAHSEQQDGAAPQATTTTSTPAADNAPLVGATSATDSPAPAPNGISASSATKDKPLPPKKISFAAMVAKGRGPSRATYADIRQASERRVCMEQDAPYPARFSRVKDSHFLVIPKNLPEIPHKDLLDQIA
ncbi:hypothetical protein BGZ95_007870, partial [Linnemannia exigua]